MKPPVLLALLGLLATSPVMAQDGIRPGKEDAEPSRQPHQRPLPEQLQGRVLSG
jgi:hypothetical protein